MEKLSKILHNLDQGNINVSTAKQQILDLYHMTQDCKCTNCNTDLKFGISDELLSSIENSKLFKLKKQ